LFVFTGTKELCENSVSAIEKANNNDTHRDEIDSYISDQLIIDSKTEESDDDGNEH
jgi:hypothetical protein